MSKQIVIRVAEITLGIEYRHGLIPALCRGYVQENAFPEFWLSATEEEIVREQNHVEPPISAGLAEANIVYRKLGDLLVNYDAFLLHGAVIEYEGIGYAFSAPSGVGKTTHIGLWKKRFGDSVRIINGDKPIVRLIGDTFYAYGTPWCGKEGYSVNDRCELLNLCFIERGDVNEIVSIEPQKAFSRLLPQVMLPFDSVKTLRVMDLLGHFFEKGSMYVLRCTPTEEAAEVAYYGMSRKERI